MKSVTQINFAKSIEKKWLFYKEPLFDKFDTLMHIIMAIVMCYGDYMMIISQQTFNENEKFFIYAKSLATLIVCFIAFKKLTEKRLKIIETKNNEEQNAELLKRISKKNRWTEFRSIKNVYIFYDDNGDWNNYIKIFLLKNNKIYYTVLTERFKLNYPTLTENIAVKKLIKNSACR